jgi:hypothetical protein
MICRTISSPTSHPRLRAALAQRGKTGRSVSSISPSISKIAPRGQKEPLLLFIIKGYPPAPAYARLAGAIGRGKNIFFLNFLLLMTILYNGIPKFILKYRAGAYAGNVTQDEESV